MLQVSGPQGALQLLPELTATKLLVLTQGVVRNDGWNWSDENVTLFLSDTAGGITETAPSTSGDCVQIVGWSISDDEAYINISGHYLEVE
jgi:hypothetical protein